MARRNMKFKLLKEDKLLLDVVALLENDYPELDIIQDSDLPMKPNENLVHITIEATVFMNGNIKKASLSLDKKYLTSSLCEYLMFWQSLGYTEVGHVSTSRNKTIGTFREYLKPLEPKDTN